MSDTHDQLILSFDLPVSAPLKQDIISEANHGARSAAAATEQRQIENNVPNVMMPNVISLVGFMATGCRIFRWLETNSHRHYLRTSILSVHTIYLHQVLCFIEPYGKLNLRLVCSNTGHFLLTPAYLASVNNNLMCIYVSENIFTSLMSMMNASHINVIQIMYDFMPLDKPHRHSDSCYK